MRLAQFLTVLAETGSNWSDTTDATTRRRVLCLSDLANRRTERLVVEISVDVDPVAGPAAYIGFDAIAVLVFDTKTQQRLH